MNKKIVISVIIVGAIITVVIFALNNTKNSIPADSSNQINQNSTQNKEAETAPAGATLQDGDNIITNVSPDQIIDLTTSADPVKEIVMTSFVEFVDEKPRPQFSFKEIIVNKGDKVRIKVTVTKGVHDFKIDEFGVYLDTKELNQEYAVEFTADQAGEFTYYCTKPGHRQSGHWGILKVIDK